MLYHLADAPWIKVDLEDEHELRDVELLHREIRQDLQDAQIPMNQVEEPFIENFV